MSSESTQRSLLEPNLDSDSESDDSDIDLQPEFDVEQSDSDEDMPGPSYARASTSSGASTRQSRRQTRSNVRGRRGRGRRTPSPAADEGWIEVEYGAIGDIPVFTGAPGIQVNVPGDKTPIDYFHLFIGDEMLDLFVKETNRYADLVAVKLPGFYYLKIWNPVDVVEMKKFLALLMTMGLMVTPEIRHCWSTHPVLHTPFFGKVMSRDRFLSILAFFHLADNSQMPPANSPGSDKLFKIRKLFDHLCKTFRETYYPEQNLAVDESIIPWRGRVAFRQFIPMKPIRYGLKLYCCCESASGYICSMKMYTGKEGGSVEHGHGPNVVKYVTQEFMQVGHCIFMDSFFSSVALFQDLLQSGTTACGTVLRLRRGNPPSLKSKTLRLAKGECAVRQKGGVVAMRFRDRRDCMLLSTAHTAAPVATGKKKRLRDGTQVDITRPAMVQKYNENMGGVDTLDQLLSYYSFNRKTMKWWKRAATHLIHMAKVQAFILYKKEGKSLTQVDFTLQLILQLAGDTSTDTQDSSAQTLSDPVPGPSTSTGLQASEDLPTLQHRQHTEPEPSAGPSGEEPPRKRQKVAKPAEFERLENSMYSHFLEEIPPTAKKAKPAKRCVCCSVYSKRSKQYTHRKESRFQCRKCKVPLCVTPCHKVYHTVKDYEREMRRLNSGETGTQESSDED